MNEVEEVKTKDDIYMVTGLLEKHGSPDYRDIWELGINAAFSSLTYCPLSTQTLMVSMY